MNANERWTDVLAERLQTSASGANIGVLNQGIGGNAVLSGMEVEMTPVAARVFAGEAR